MTSSLPLLLSSSSCFACLKGVLEEVVPLFLLPTSVLANALCPPQIGKALLKLLPQWLQALSLFLACLPRLLSESTPIPRELLDLSLLPCFLLRACSSPCGYHSKSASALFVHEVSKEVELGFNWATQRMFQYEHDVLLPNCHILSFWPLDCLPLPRFFLLPSLDWVLVNVY